MFALGQKAKTDSMQLRLLWEYITHFCLSKWRKNFIKSPVRQLDFYISVLVYIDGEAHAPQQKQVKVNLQEAINLNKYFIIANNVLECTVVNPGSLKLMLTNE